MTNILRDKSKASAAAKMGVSYSDKTEAEKDYFKRIIDRTASYDETFFSSYPIVTS
jgi:hypothetical protein